MQKKTLGPGFAVSVPGFVIRFGFYQKPCWHMASATFLKPAIFAPLT